MAVESISLEGDERGGVGSTDLGIQVEHAETTVISEPRVCESWGDP